MSTLLILLLLLTLKFAEQRMFEHIPQLEFYLQRRILTYLFLYFPQIPDVIASD